MPSSNPPLFLTRESKSHADQVDRLIQSTFPQNITHRPVYRFRSQRARVHALCRIALDHQGAVQGCIRFFGCQMVDRQTNQTVGQALLLGPLSVSVAYRGLGLAHQLIGFSLAEARSRGWGPCFVVGDPLIYRRHGFCNATSVNVQLAGQDDLRRFLVAEISGGQFAPSMRGTALMPLSDPARRAKEQNG